MDLSTTYMGLKLRTPLTPSASPLSESIDSIKKMEDAGASAIVLYSLFEEQLRMESKELHHHMVQNENSFSEAASFFPEPHEFKLGPEEYLNHIRRAKSAVKIPIIASLNGTSLGGWTSFSKQMEQAGADALELNIYYIPTNARLSAEAVEQTYIDILKAVKSTVKIPVAIKLSPYFSSMSNMAKKLDDAGADALVLFNRFYQPDFDLENLEVMPSVLLSTPQAMRLPLTWVGLLFGKIKANLAATSGIYKAEDVVKLLMAGANATMLCSVLLRYGIKQLRAIEDDLKRWMEVHEYDSVKQMQGSMSQMNCSEPDSFERAQYIKTLHSFKPE